MFPILPRRFGEWRKPDPGFRKVTWNYSVPPRAPQEKSVFSRFGDFRAGPKTGYPKKAAPKTTAGPSENEKRAGYRLRGPARFRGTEKDG
jgi:hypothetical protein